MILFYSLSATAQLVTEGTNGYWKDDPNGPDVVPPGNIDTMTWVADPISQRVTDKDIVFMGSFVRENYVQPLATIGDKTIRALRIKGQASSQNISGEHQLKIREQKQIAQFFKNWANACPGDKMKKKLPSNRLQMVPFQNLKKLFDEKNPDILVFQYQNSPPKFNGNIWRRFISQVPAGKGCLVIAPDPQSETAQNNRQYSLALESFFRTSNHHCQVIHRVLYQGVQDIMQGVCDRDYRTHMNKNG